MIKSHFCLEVENVMAEPRMLCKKYLLEYVFFVQVGICYGGTENAM